jgi:hypothetical protein
MNGFVNNQECTVKSCNDYFEKCLVRKSVGPVNYALLFFYRAKIFVVYKRDEEKHDVS